MSRMRRLLAGASTAEGPALSIAVRMKDVTSASARSKLRLREKSARSRSETPQRSRMRSSSPSSTRAKRTVRSSIDMGQRRSSMGPSRKYSLIASFRMQRISWLTFTGPCQCIKRDRAARETRLESFLSDDALNVGAMACRCCFPFLVFEDDGSAFHHRTEDPALPARLLAGPAVAPEELTTELRVRGERRRQGTQAHPQGKSFMAEQDAPERLTQVSVRAKRLPGDRGRVRDVRQRAAHGGELLEIGRVTGLEARCAATHESRPLSRIPYHSTCRLRSLRDGYATWSVRGVGERVLQRRMTMVRQPARVMAYNQLTRSAHRRFR